MNVPQNETCPESLGLGEERSADVSNDLMKNAVPIGTFAGPQDFVFRFHEGKPAATNSGGQGGGQN